MVSAVAERYGLWDDEIFVTVVKRVTQAASPASLQLHERVCVNRFASSFNSAESASAVICAVETQFLYLLSWF